MDTRLYVGNLSDDVSTEALKKRFAEYGDVTDVQLAMDRSSGRPRGHAFVTMPNAAEARAAMTQLNGSLFEDRPLRVNVAGEEREKTRVKADPSIPRIASQFRERLNMTYELEWQGGVRLAIRMFPTDPKESEWRIEACTKGVEGADDTVVSASAPTRANALAEVAREWTVQTTAAGLPALDWAAITQAMAAVRAI
jgi:RNA recognition motif-containing protein